MPTDRPTGIGRTTSNGRTSKRTNSRITMASSDTLDADQLLAVLVAVRKGDFSVKMPMSQHGIAGKISDALNDIIELNRETTREFERVSQAVGKEGKITQRAHLNSAAGSWAASVNSVNTLIGDLVQPTSEVARVTESEQAALELAETRAELVRDLEHKNRELESFSYAVSHDLRAPLRRIDSFSRAVLESQAGLDEQGRHYLERVREASQHMSQLIDDVLYLSRVTRADLRDQEVDLSALATLILSRLQESEPARKVEIKVRPGVVVTGDGQLLRIALENLLENAWKFTSNQPESRIEFGVTQASGEPTYFVRDNGAGFDMTYADRLFGPFQRLHPQGEFAGSGIGLATVQRIIHRHGGQVWAEGLVGQGATFQFTLGRIRS